MFHIQKRIYICGFDIQSLRYDESSINVLLRMFCDKMREGERERKGERERGKEIEKTRYNVYMALMIA